MRKETLFLLSLYFGLCLSISSECLNDFCQICKDPSSFQCLHCRGSLQLLDELCYCPGGHLISGQFECIEQTQISPNNLFKTIEYCNLAGLFVLIVAGKTTHFSFFIEFAQNLVILRLIAFYYGIGLEKSFNAFDIFFGSISSGNEQKEVYQQNNPEDNKLPPKIQILEGFYLNFVQNIAGLLIFLLIAGGISLFVSILRQRVEFQEEGLCYFLRNKLQWQLFERTSEFICLPVSVFSILELCYNPLKSFNDNANYGLAVCFLCSYGVYLFWLFYQLNYLTFSPGHEVLYEGLKIYSFIGRNYFPLRLICKIMVGAFIALFMSNFRAQLISIAMVYLTRVLLTVFSRPFFYWLVNVVETVNCLFLFFLYTLLLYTSYYLANIKELGNTLRITVILALFCNSLPIYFAIIQNYQQLKNNIMSFPLKFAVFKKKAFFIEFEEKPSQNTKENINPEQRHFDEFFQNPSPEISENTQEIARINLGNYVQTEQKENERFENHKNKKKLVQIISKSYTTREKSGGKHKECSFSQREENKGEDNGLVKGKSARSFKDMLFGRNK